MKIPFSIRLETNDIETLREIAKNENRSMAKQIAHWIKQYQQHLLKESA